MGKYVSLWVMGYGMPSGRWYYNWLLLFFWNKHIAGCDVNITERHPCVSLHEQSSITSSKHKHAKKNRVEMGNRNLNQFCFNFTQNICNNFVSEWRINGPWTTDIVDKVNSGRYYSYAHNLPVSTKVRNGHMDTSIEFTFSQCILIKIAN